MVLNGPNLNMLGQREPEIYGTTTLDDIRSACDTLAGELGLTVDVRQSNHEGELVTWIQEARTEHGGIIINAAAYTHTSIAIADALKLADLPVIEVHLSNVHARESFRQHSYFSDIAVGVICGLGSAGYDAALSHALQNT